MPHEGLDLWGAEATCHSPALPPPPQQRLTQSQLPGAPWRGSCCPLGAVLGTFFVAAVC